MFRNSEKYSYPGIWTDFILKIYMHLFYALPYVFIFKFKFFKYIQFLRKYDYIHFNNNQLNRQ